MAIKKVLFLNLRAFSVTGGIEKFNRAFLKALADIEKEGKVEAYASSVYDDKVDARYFAVEKYKGFNGNRFRFAFYVVSNAYKYDALILSHIHLSSIALLAKLFFPSKQLIVVAHGIEVWRKLSKVQRSILHKADKILAVSNFTRQKLIAIHKVEPNKVAVFHNTIDPYFSYPEKFEKPEYLLKRYGLSDEPIVFTLTRISSADKKKGYDVIIKIMSRLRKAVPGVKYILAGKHDETEKSRLDNLISEQQVDKNFLLTGFIKDEEVVDHYLLADVFILPSYKEGFGIVFIEAMACGLAVIAGNKDGSADALQQGQLGILVDPKSEKEVLHALTSILLSKNVTKAAAKRELQQKVREGFGFDTFKNNLRQVLA